MSKPINYSDVACAACGDPGYAMSWVRHRVYCRTCYNEVEFGIIKNQNIAMSGGTASTIDPDAGGYQANARRFLEDA
jgi:hypothetical protein